MALNVPYRYPGQGELPTRSVNEIYRDFEEVQRFLKDVTTGSGSGSPASGTLCVGNTGAGDGDGDAIMGTWPGSDAYAFFGNCELSANNSMHYGMIVGGDGADPDTYIGAAATGGHINFRLANNGNTEMEITDTAGVIIDDQLIVDDGSNDAVFIGEHPVHTSWATVSRADQLASTNYRLLMSTTATSLNAPDDGEVRLVIGSSTSFDATLTEADFNVSVPMIIDSSSNDDVFIGEHPAQTTYGTITRADDLGSSTYILIFQDANTILNTISGTLRLRYANGERFTTGNTTATNRLYDNGGTVVATFGNGNQTLGANKNICMAIPQITGVTMTRAAGSTQIGTLTSTRRLKKNVRSLREEAEADALARSMGLPPQSGDSPAALVGPPEGTAAKVRDKNPIFDMNPIRFNWVEWDEELQDGVYNGKEFNECVPTGEVGLIVEEVAKVAPDACAWHTGSPEWHWAPEQEGDIPPEDPRELYRPAVEPYPISLQPFNLIGYLVEAVQYLKEEIHELKLGGSGDGR